MYLLRLLLYRMTSPQMVVWIFRPLFVLMGLNRRDDVPLLEAKRVLIIRLDEIGDLVLFTPFLRELRRNLPQAHITLIIRPATKSLLQHSPYIDELLTFEPKTVPYWGHLTRLGEALGMGARHLWRRRYDLAVLPRWDVDYYHGAYLLFFSGAARRVGFAEDVTGTKARENRGYDRFYTDLCRDSGLRHEVEQNLALLRFLGGSVESCELELPVGQEARKAAQALVGPFTSSGKRLIALAPGAGSPRRCWPAERFAATADLLKDETYNFVVIGGTGDRIAAETICAALGERGLNLTGCCSLLVTAAVLEECDLYLGSDSGPMHIAAAVGTPVVEISCHPATGSPYHANSPIRFGPWAVPATILQPPRPWEPSCAEGCAVDNPHCILAIPEQEVAEAAQALLQRTKGEKKGADA